MLKWFKKQNTNVKLMIILIILFVIGIIIRWDYISGEITDSFTGLFEERGGADSIQAVPDKK